MMVFYIELNFSIEDMKNRKYFGALILFNKNENTKKTD
jgi:hypothetical protein